MEQSVFLLSCLKKWWSMSFINEYLIIHLCYSVNSSHVVKFQTYHDRFSDVNEDVYSVK